MSKKYTFEHNIAVSPASNISLALEVADLLLLIDPCLYNRINCFLLVVT